MNVPGNHIVEIYDSFSDEDVMILGDVMDVPGVADSDSTLDVTMVPGSAVKVPGCADSELVMGLLSPSA